MPVAQVASQRIYMWHQANPVPVICLTQVNENLTNPAIPIQELRLSASLSIPIVLGVITELSFACHSSLFVVSPQL